MKYVNHSGGCPGADMCWETNGLKYGVETIAYSFHNHIHESSNPKILTVDELREGLIQVKIAARTLKRPVDGLYPYVQNLLSRNWFQVKNADAIYAIGMFQTDAHLKVDGGTGWAVQMALDVNKPVFFFDQLSKQWYNSYFSLSTPKFIPLYEIPILTHNFAGIGTRRLSDHGKMAILDVYEHTFKSNNE